MTYDTTESEHRVAVFSKTYLKWKYKDHITKCANTRICFSVEFKNQTRKINKNVREKALRISSTFVCISTLLVWQVCELVFKSLLFHVLNFSSHIFFSPFIPCSHVTLHFEIDFIPIHFFCWYWKWTASEYYCARRLT